VFDNASWVGALPRYTGVIYGDELSEWNRGTIASAMRTAHFAIDASAVISLSNQTLWR